MDYIGYESLLNSSKKFKSQDFEFDGGKVNIQELSGGNLSAMNEAETANDRLAIVLFNGLVKPKMMDLKDCHEMIDKNYKLANEVGIEILKLSGVIEPEKN